MTTVILSKTRMHGGYVCVGGFDMDAHRNVRLLSRTGANQPQGTPFQIGEHWDIAYIPRIGCVPPHVEDVLIQSSRRVGTRSNLSEFIRQNCPVIQGSLSRTFEGQLQFTAAGSGYIARNTGLPQGSVCFWESDGPLVRNDYGAKVRYDYAEGLWRRHISFVGFQEPPDVIEQGGLVRLSLARWWKPRDAPTDEEEKCFLQLSGYFP